MHSCVGWECRRNWFHAKILKVIYPCFKFFLNQNRHVIYFQHKSQDQSAAPQWMLDTHKIIQVGIHLSSSSSSVILTCQESDGFLIVTPEYNCSLPPALTNLLDHFPPASFRHKPASIAAYSMGPFGGHWYKIILALTGALEVAMYVLLSVSHLLDCFLQSFCFPN